MRSIFKKAVSSIIVACLLSSLLYVPTTALPLTKTEVQTVDSIETQSQIFERITQDCAVLNYIDEETFRAAGHINRLPDEEDLYSYVFENADGTRTAYIMPEPVKYVDNNHNIKDKHLSFSEKTASCSALLTGKSELQAYEIKETDTPWYFLPISQMACRFLMVDIPSICAPKHLLAKYLPQKQATKSSIETPSVLQLIWYIPLNSQGSKKIFFCNPLPKIIHSPFCWTQMA